MILILLMLFTQTKGEITKIQREIQILNLINGLELSKYQMIFILEKTHEVDQIKAEFYEEIESNAELFLEILKRLKENRMKNKEIPDELRRAVFLAEERMHSLRAEMYKSIDSIINEVIAVLDGNQLYQLEHYVPCLIPPKGETRIGQSENPEGVVLQLTRIHDMPDWLYDLKKEQLVEKTVERLKRHLPRGGEFDEKSEQKRISRLFEEIRGLSDVDFILQKKFYAEELKGKYLSGKTPLNLSFKIEKFLFDPLVSTILEEKIRIKQTTEGKGY
ncbi:MAG TPA: hypothetical protein ENI34_00470 [candidate division WOR-3 bacterium]|uniref:Uncharacterized protein n=1 Tax=candidate division WOR-3 bacterium TaxID=2052148 RepID=A0A9C9EKJ2_UNCW3|nr:hypothetical protein [candidate division WOR-3 bacterium]